VVEILDRWPQYLLEVLKVEENAIIFKALSGKYYADLVVVPMRVFATSLVVA
jgi:hypothetical protein